VTDSNDGFPDGVTLRDSSQSIPGAVRDVREFFAARNLDLCRLSSPFLDELRVVLLNFGKCQTFQLAMIQFANVVFDQHGKPVRQTDKPSGLLGAFQIT
jgi:hypothetical protein